jgi:cell division protein FtsL
MNEKQEPQYNQPDTKPPAQIQEPHQVNATPETPATAEQLTEVEEQMSGFEKSTLRWAKTAVIMSAIAAVFVCAQWWEMHEGGIDTHDLAVAAKDQAAAAKAQVEELKKEAADTHELAVQAKNQADQSTIQARATSVLATTTAKQLIATEDAERAIIKVKIVWDSKNRTLSYYAQNIGPTAATDAAFEGGGGGGYPCNGLFRLSDTSLKNLHSSPGGLVLGAGELTPNQMFVGGLNVESMTDLVRSSQLCPYYMAGVGYKDIFGREQTSYACLVFIAMPDFRECHIVDDTKRSQKKQKLSHRN